MSTKNQYKWIVRDWNKKIMASGATSGPIAWALARFTAEAVIGGRSGWTYNIVKNY